MSGWSQWSITNQDAASGIGGGVYSNAWAITIMSSSPEYFSCLLFLPHPIHPPTENNKRNQESREQPCWFLGTVRGSTTTSQRGSCLLGGQGPWGFLKLLQSWVGAHKGNTKSSVGPRVPATPPLWFVHLGRHKGSQSINQDSVLRHPSPLSLPHW